MPRLGLGAGLGASTAVGGVGASPVTYLPTGLSVAPQMAYGMAKLFPSYSGNLARVVRRSDSATLNIAPEAGGQQADMSGFAAFLGASTVGVDLWYEQSGSGAGDAPQATDASRPSIFLGNAWNGRQPMTMGVPSIAGATAGNIASRFLNRPAVNSSRQGFSLFWCGIIGGGSFDSIGLSGLGTDAGSTNNLSMLYDSNAQLRYLGNAFVAAAVPPACQPTVISLIASGSATKVRINGIQVFSGSAMTAFTLVGGYLGRGSWSTATIGPADTFADVTYPGVLTDAEALQVETALATIGDALVGASTRLMYFDGDSMTAGLNESGYLRNLPRQVIPQVTGPRPLITNFGTAGITAASLNTRIATTYGKIGGTLFSSVTSKACHLWAGTNDIAALVSGSIVGGETAIYASILASAQYYANGARFGSGKVAVGTILPRSWTGSTADQAQREVVRLNLNTLIRDGAAANGYTVLDYGAIPQLTTGPGSAPPSDASGNINPPASAYYGVSSGVHINPAGYALCAAIAAPWFNSVLS